ncbi:hypothetical protein NDAWWUGD_CDS0146 [Salmonella phage SeKF_80]
MTLTLTMRNVGRVIHRPLRIVSPHFGRGRVC